MRIVWWRCNQFRYETPHGRDRLRTRLAAAPQRGEVVGNRPAEPRSVWQTLVPALATLRIKLVLTAAPQLPRWCWTAEEMSPDPLGSRYSALPARGDYPSQEGLTFAKWHGQPSIRRQSTQARYDTGIPTARNGLFEHLDEPDERRCIQFFPVPENQIVSLARPA